MEPTDLEVGVGPRNNPTWKERITMKQLTYHVLSGAHTCMMGEGRTHHHTTKSRRGHSSRGPTISIDYFSMKHHAVADRQTIADEPVALSR